MGSQLRFDPSFFSLALRASAEADALLFSAHEGLSGITRPTRAGLRLTSPAKASGGWGGRICETSRWIQIRENDFEGRSGRGSQCIEKEVRVARAKTLPSISWHAKGRLSRGIYPGGVSGGERGSGGASGASTAATAAGHASEASTAGHAWGNERK